MNWTVTYTPEPGRPTFKMRAVSADGQRVITTDRLTREEIWNYDFDADWRLAVRKFHST